MFKKLIPLIILIVFFALAINLVLSRTANLKTAKPAPTLTPVPAQPVVGESTGSFVDLFSSIGDSQVCTFESTLAGGSVAKGVMYSGNGQLRGDFTAKVKNKTTESHIIVLSDYSYWWIDGEKTGTQSYFGEEDLSLFNDNTSSSSAQTETPISSNFTCNDWKVDDSIFELPKDVKFSLSSKLQDQGKSQCSVCDEVKGVQRVECLKNLNCN